MKKILILALCLAVPLAGCTVHGEDALTTVIVEETPATMPQSQCEAAGENEPNGVVSKYDSLPMHKTFEEANGLNDDVIGWITIDGTIIDYPVVRTKDNDFYLTHDANGDKSDYGAIFMDFRNAESRMQKHIILYGHNMKNGTMFHDLVNYKQKDFFTENSRIYLFWDGIDTEWEIFCAYIVEPDTIYPIRTLFDDDEHFADIMNDSLKYAGTVRPSCVDDTVIIQPSDQVLSLITCTYEYDDSRFVVMARRVS